MYQVIHFKVEKPLHEWWYVHADDPENPSEPVCKCITLQNAEMICQALNEKFYAKAQAQV